MDRPRQNHDGVVELWGQEIEKEMASLRFPQALHLRLPWRQPLPSTRSLVRSLTALQRLIPVDYERLEIEHGK